MDIDPGKKQKLNEYFDDIFPENARVPHPFTRFRLHEIVVHGTWGHGIVTGFRIPDRVLELEGMGVQFVERGQMKEHRVFTPRECHELEGSGIEFDIERHTGKPLEDIYKK